jgi:spermidine synthase
VTPLLYLLFFLSGLSGLIYQVVWVRVFGNVFGNTVYSAAMVVAVFMLGLGVGSYVVGAWADRRYAERPDSLLRAYGYIELVIAALGFAISALLPHLEQLSAIVSTYQRDAQGWYVLSSGSYVARGAIAVLLLAPITLLMGGTLTLLIRHLVRRDVAVGGWRIALLYSVNTAGAAIGCLLTDFALVPEYGLRNTQFIAVALNAVAGVGAVYMARVRLKPDPATASKKRRTARLQSVQASPAAGQEERRGRLQPAQQRQAPEAWSPEPAAASVPFVAAALALAGFAALGMEILWFRHFTIMLGQFRAVFSLLLAVILIGIGTGALGAGMIARRSARPAAWFMGVQALLVVFTLLGLFLADSRATDATIISDPSFRGGVGSGSAGALAELWFNARPMLLEVAVPALLMGFGFPLANAIVQRAERSVGRRAGALYLANTAGAVAGSLATGFLLLPALGLQGSVSVLMLTAAAAIPAVYGGSRHEARSRHSFAAALVAAGAAVGLWLSMPGDYVIARALPTPGVREQVLTLKEGVNEVITVTEAPGRGRTLLTNGHPMSSTLPFSQRYMRALAHLPLLSMDNPQRVLVIGFGVGNTTQAATLHPSIERVEVADLSRDVLDHARYFQQFNKGVLRDPRVAVHVNDGRQHLLMQPPASYDLVTLEPPPIGYAGVAALYSREFYELTKSRLKPGGYLSQWLPAYQVPSFTTLAMVRAFIDVFPDAVLVSGAESDLLLLGANGGRVEVDPAALAAKLARAPLARADLQRIDLGTPTELIGTFVASAATLASATRDTPPVTDDRPIQEYGVMSLLNFGEAVPSSIVKLDEVSAWCPRCFADGKPAPPVADLEVYLALLGRAYRASSDEVRRARVLAETEGRVVAGSGYLGAVVPESADLHNLLGIALASSGKIDEAVAEFREALRLDPAAAATHWHLGAALAGRGERAQALDHLQRSVELDPGNAEAQNDLGLMLALQGRLDDAIRQFERALALDPGHGAARANLAAALRQRQREPATN